MSFTCGSHQNKILGKHLEIPACRCCMVAEDMPMLREYGFIDTVNCVTADENNVVEKVDYLFSNQQELKRITDAGYQHVKSMIAPETQYNTIYEWFKLFKRLKPDEKIVQTGVFALEIIKRHQIPGRKINFGPDTLEKKWQEGYQALQNNNFELALNHFNDALKIIPYCPEANTGLGIILLLHLKASQAEMFFVKNIQHVISLGGLSDFHDPVDIALIIVCKMCQNKQDEAIRMANCWLETKHPALDAARFLATGSEQFLKGEKYSPSRLPLAMNSEQWLLYYSSIFERYGISQ
jgi:hypothetical protein